MVVNIPGVIGIVVFYIIIVVIGIWAGRKNKKGDTNDLLVAGRSLGMFVATLTTAATMVGGAYINGTAESMGRDGFLWTIGPVGYNLSLILAALIYVPKVRKAEYTTIFDPIQEKYGNRTGGLLFIPELLGDLFWEAAIFNALGATVSIILGIEMSIAIIVSAVIVIVYTFFGGLYSVAYTDVIQMFFIIIGLVMALPFAWTNPAVDFSRISNTWQGEMDSNQIGIYIDTCLLTLGGCLTWQIYMQMILHYIIKAFYQRILACKSVTVARNSALLGAGISWLMAIPPAAIGVIGAATDWNMTSYPQNSTLSYEDWTFILPMVMEYLCPLTVSIIGFGAISAAVMSSADSIVLATGSVFSRNIYQNCFRPQASDRELTWVLRFSIVVVGTLGAVIAISANSIYGLYILCADAMYVVQFPVLTCALWVPFANTYGAISGFVVGTTLRVLGGEPVLSFPAIIKYPGYNDTLGQLFPFKTFAMMSCTFSLLSISYLTEYMFTKRKLSKKFDIFNCYGPKSSRCKNDGSDISMTVKTEDDVKNETDTFLNN
ncbi:high affinity choline transporter 1-like isoform X1 [Mytilus edulis]|uniref:high affinity choline transporter 1-like isoform X1 n=1 Tax=Mytilus edulis TaxID=6550 RepID=UPI0039EF64D4